MAQHKNPQIQVVIQSEDEVIIKKGDSEKKRVYMDFDIEKTREEEPNTASLTMYNLNDSTRGLLSNSTNLDTPVEIWLTPPTSTELALAYKGNLDDVYSEKMRGGGHETNIKLLSQPHVWYIDSVSFAAGTPQSDILSFLMDNIILPRQTVDLGVFALPITLSQSFTGPALPLLQRFAKDLGLYVWISDGVLFVSAHDVAANLAINVLASGFLLDDPQPAQRSDKAEIEKRTIAEATTVVNPYLLNTKKTKTTKRETENDYETFDAVDTQVTGMDFSFMCLPDVQVDDIVSTPAVEFGARLFRVTKVHHYGNNETFDEFNTDLKTDDYELI